MLETVAPTIIRPAEQRELARVVAVLYAAHSEFAEVLPEALYRAYMANLLDVPSRLHESQLLVAEREGRIVGTSTLYPDASREGWGWPVGWAGIRAVAVAPDARGLGIGSALTTACIARARALGARTVCLHTAAFMAAAVAMYERLGFRRIPECDCDLSAMFPSQPAGASLTAIAYCLEL